MALHDDQLDSDENLVRQLLAQQFPQWTRLPVSAVSTSGTECAIYRLGDDMAVRLPYRPSKDEQVAKLFRWLPILGPQLPLPISEIIAIGAVSEDFPATWSVVRWLPGEEVIFERLADPVQSARTLAAFVCTLMSIDPTGGPVPGPHNFWRGVPLGHRDQWTRHAVEASAGHIDTRAVIGAWERDLDAPIWRGEPCWLHGDLAPDNLLMVDGRLSAVIDWGGLGVGDPATECLPAWNLFRGRSRAAYREALGFDDATWARGRGLALSVAIVALPYYLETLPARAQRARYIISEVLEDQKRHA